MIVVMPLGYGDYDFVTHGFSVWNEDAKVNGNVVLFTQTLEQEVMPMVEVEYNVAKGRENRAIAGFRWAGWRASPWGWGIRTSLRGSAAELCAVCGAL